MRAAAVKSSIVYYHEPVKDTGVRPADGDMLDQLLVL